MRGLLFLIFLCSFFNLHSQRQIFNLNAHWIFQKPNEDVTLVNIPHTFNVQDAFDDIPGYFRGKVRYIKSLPSDKLDPLKNHFLKFDAVNQTARVYINKEYVGEHKGGYTAFLFDVTKYLNYNSDTLIVEVDNSHDESIVPLRGDFTFYGGIYRDVNIISTNPIHFSLEKFASDGIFIHPNDIGENEAKLLVNGFCHNAIGKIVDLEILNADLEKVYETQTIVSGEEWNLNINLSNPHLWSIEDPYQYVYNFTIREPINRTIYDKVSINYGIRSFSFDANKGFYLNGNHVKLIGVNRHQDRKGLGNALSDENHAEDVQMIKNSGFNFLRTAHYPQDKTILFECDRLGIITSMEIPLDHEISNTENFYTNSENMVMEMVYQYYNHPSIVIWAYMNEMGLGKQVSRDSISMVRITNMALKLENKIRAADPHRFTMIPNHGNFDIYHKFGLTEIPMIVGWNLYYGWYEPNFEGFGEFIDHAKSMVPDKPILITEYGAGADPRITSFDPRRFDFSLDWTMRFHQSHLSQILARPFIAGSAVWNMFDFGSEARNDAVPHVNNKGLVSYDRKPKSVLYLYQSHLQKDTIIQIAELPDIIILNEAESKSIPVDIVSNKNIVEIESGGKVESIPIESYIGEYNWAIKPGINTLTINGTEKYKSLLGIPMDTYWDNYNVLNINFGSNFYFHSSYSNSTWHPDQELPSDFIKIVKGSPYQPRDRGIGTDKGISLTDDDPIYQTMIEGLESISIRLPSGKYKFIFHLAKLNKSENIQDITLNNTAVNLPEFSPFTAYQTEIDTYIKDKVDISFKGETKNTYINAMQIIKLL